MSLMGLSCVRESYEFSESYESYMSSTIAYESYEFYVSRIYVSLMSLVVLMYVSNDFSVLYALAILKSVPPQHPNSDSSNAKCSCEVKCFRFCICVCRCASHVSSGYEPQFVFPMHASCESYGTSYGPDVVNMALRC